MPNITYFLKVIYHDDTPTYFDEFDNSEEASAAYWATIEQRREVGISQFGDCAIIILGGIMPDGKRKTFDRTYFD